MSRSLTSCLLLAIMTAGGCATNPHPHSGEMVAEYHSGEKAVVTQTPYKANYALYREPSHSPETPPSPSGDNPADDFFLLRPLSRHESVGFIKAKEGRLLAVAGTEQVPLPDGHYCWHITPETEYRGLDRGLKISGDKLAAVAAGSLEVVGEILLFPLYILMYGGGSMVR